MSVKTNKRIVREFYDALNEKDLDRTLGFLSDSVVVKEPSSQETIEGKDKMRGFVDAFWTAFPDSEIEETRVFGEGDWVCHEHLDRATHEGPLKTGEGEEIPPTHNSFELSEVALFKVQDEEIAEMHLYYDQVSMMKQLGISP